jgi:outer membrane protein TolC
VLSTYSSIRWKIRGGVREVVSRVFAMRFLGLLGIGVLSCAPVYSQRKLSLIEAVEITLANNPDIQIQRQQLAIGQGLKREAAGQFDWFTNGGLSQGRQSLPLTTYDQLYYRLFGVQTSSDTTNLTTMTGEVDRVFRDGISFTGQFLDLRTTDNLLNGGAAASGANRSSTTFTLSVPLRGGRGRQVVAAQEIQATIESEARERDLEQVVTQSITNTVRSYWALVSAVKQLEVAVESETRGRTLQDNMQILIEADQHPRSDLYDFSGNLAERTSSRVAADNAVIAARTQLALDMGLKPESIETLPDPADDFPEPANLTGENLRGINTYVDMALRNRPDILSARKREQEAAVGVTAAKDLWLSRVNLGFTAGYDGLREGGGGDRYLGALLLGGRGLNAQVGVTYSSSVNKSLAAGRTVEAEAQSRQAGLQTKNLERQLSGDIFRTLYAVRNALDEVRSADESVRYFKEALAGERDKLQLGIGSVVSMLTVEDRLTSALVQLVQARLEYPLAVIQLRFDTGTLVTSGSPTQRIDMTTLTTLPTQ